MRDSILLGLYATTQFEMLDEVVPINQVAELIKYTKALGNKHNLKVLNFGHSGDGNVHTIMIRDNYSDEAWPLVRKAFLDDLYTEIYRLGGLISAEHGIGVYKQEHFLIHTPKANVEAMRAIKKALDPKNLLNPGKIF
jgi:glycolate oxidase